MGRPLALVPLKGRSTADLLCPWCMIEFCGVLPETERMVLCVQASGLDGGDEISVPSSVYRKRRSLAGTGSP
ncbi:MAG TPA: hypothetical protein P5146_11550 [Desulfomonilia bacterium]|nr:hypothetical protein [Desulfomonilia bacterium]